jgi:aminoglycoside phosphotransferase (APT) family kinase protein
VPFLATYRCPGSCGVTTTLLDPAPIAAVPLVEQFAEAFTGWRCFAEDPGATRTLDGWSRQHLERLAEIEQTWPEAASGGALLYIDLRADNVLLTAAGAVVVDWPHACVGAPWVDLLFSLPSIAMNGGGEPQRLWDSHRPADAADPAAVTVVLTAATGFFLWRATRPAPPNLPQVRAFQRAQGEAALAWLRQRYGAGSARMRGAGP